MDGQLLSFFEDLPLNQGYLDLFESDQVVILKGLFHKICCPDKFGTTTFGIFL